MLNGGILFFDEPSRTDVSTWSLSQSGSGAVFDSPPDDLTSGLPADLTAILWTTVGSTHITDYVAINRDWTTARVIRGIEIRGVSLPAGAVISVFGRRASDTVGVYAYNLGGNSQNVGIVEFDDWSNGLIIVCDDGLDPIVGISLRVFNKNGSGFTYLVNGSYIYIGSFTCYQGYEPPEGTQFDWKPGLGGLPTNDQSANNQNRRIPNGNAYRTLSVTFEDQFYTGSFGDPSDPTAMTYNKIARYMEEDLVGFTVRYLDDSSAIDSWSIQRLSYFGTCVPSLPQPTGGNYFTLSLAFTECAPNS